MDSAFLLLESTASGPGWKPGRRMGKMPMLQITLFPFRSPHTRCGVKAMVQDATGSKKASDFFCTFFMELGDMPGLNGGNVENLPFPGTQ